jgi:hypothetical protein
MTIDIGLTSSQQMIQRLYRNANKFIQPTPNSRFSFSVLRMWRGRLMIGVVQRLNFDDHENGGNRFIIVSSLHIIAPYCG